jgi:glutamate formiminotransferase
LKSQPATFSGNPVLECVPNFSEGCSPKIVDAIAEAIRGTRGVALLGYEKDSDHNRSVFTFAGEADAVVEAAVRGVERAAKLINLSAHTGVHPRVGAADVVPFIPLADSTMADAVAAAHRTGQQIWLARACRFISTAKPLCENRRRLEKVR